MYETAWRPSDSPRNVPIPRLAATSQLMKPTRASKARAGSVGKSRKGAEETRQAHASALSERNFTPRSHGHGPAGSARCVLSPSYVGATTEFTPRFLSSAGEFPGESAATVAIRVAKEELVSLRHEKGAASLALEAELEALRTETIELSTRRDEEVRLHEEQRVQTAAAADVLASLQEKIARAPPESELAAAAARHALAVSEEEALQSRLAALRRDTAHLSSLRDDQRKANAEERTVATALAVQLEGLRAECAELTARAGEQQRVWNEAQSLLAGSGRGFQARPAFQHHPTLPDRTISRAC